MLEDETQDIKSGEVVSDSAEISTLAGNFQVEVTKVEQDGEVLPSVGVTYNTQIKDVNVNLNVTDNNGEFSYNAALGAEHEFENGVGLNAQLNHNPIETSLTVNVNKKLLINPDNINNINNQEKVRKEELIETGDQYNFQTKVGNSKEQGGFYTANSLLYRIDDENFLKAEQFYSQTQNTLSFGADLKDLNLGFKHSTVEENEQKIVTNSFNALSKEAFNQLRVNVDFRDVYSRNENEYVISESTMDVETAAVLNRNEFGEFNSGLNGEIKTALSINNGSVVGYSAGLDCAWNYYGADHEKTSDYLVRGAIEFGNQHNVKTFNAGLGGDYRINNCNTIFESGTRYSTEYTPDLREKRINGNFGVFQQVGKNFGDATLFTQVEVGKVWQNNAKGNSAFSYSEVTFGGNASLNKRLSFETKVTYDTSKKWSGEIGFSYSL